MLTGFFYISQLQNRLQKLHNLYLQWDNAMTRDCSLNFPKITSSEKVVYKNCFFFVLKFNEQSLVILWVNRFKNESFWHRFIFIKAGKNCHQLWFFITMIFTALFLKLKIIPIFEVVGLFLINVQSRAFFCECSSLQLLQSSRFFSNFV